MWRGVLIAPIPPATNNQTTGGLHVFYPRSGQQHRDLVVSVHVTTWVYDHAPKDLSPGDMLVALVLADHANAEGGNAYPSLSRMAQMTRMDERSVRRSLRRLTELGVIRVVREATNKHPTVYQFPAFRGDTMSPQGISRGDIHDTLGGTLCPSRGGVLSPKPSIEPSIEPLPPLSPKGDYTKGFDMTWTEYPHGTNSSKRKAYEAWKKLTPEERQAATDALPAFKASKRWREGYIPHASTYLNQRLWETPPPTGSNGHVEQSDEEIAAFKTRMKELQAQ